MSRVIRRDWAAVNANGVTVYSFNDFELGRDWVRRNAPLHDGLALHEIEVVARRVYRPRVAAPVRRDAFAIPAVPA